MTRPNGTPMTTRQQPADAADDDDRGEAAVSRGFDPKSDRDFLVFGRPVIGEEEIAEVVATLRSGWIGTGPRVEQFERDFATYVSASRAIAVSSCTAGLHLGLLASGVGPGDEVITSPLTFPSTASVIVHCGAVPVFADVDRTSMNISPDAVEAAITERTKAVIPVHMAGRPCDMDRLVGIAAHHGLTLINDAAHAIEAEYHGRKIQAYGDVTCYSFYATKNITTGDGGMVTTEDRDLADRIRLLSLQGLSRDAWQRYSVTTFEHYRLVLPGHKYNMTDIQAALGLCQLRKIEAFAKRRTEIWDSYNTAFRDLPVATPVPDAPRTRHAHHLYTLLVDRARCGVGRDELIHLLLARGIGTGVHFTALHEHPYYATQCGFRRGDFPNAEHIGDRTISLPLAGNLTDRDVRDVVDAVRHSLQR